MKNIKLKKILIGIIFFLCFITFNVSAKGNWSCTYSKLDDSGKKINKEIIVKPSPNNDEINIVDEGKTKSVKIYNGMYEEKCNLVETLINSLASATSSDDLICNNIDMTSRLFLNSDNTCNKYLYTVKTATQGTVYVMGDKNPKNIPAFKSKFSYYGKIKSQTDSNGNTKVSIRQGDEKSDYDDFYGGYGKNYLKCGKLKKIPVGLPSFTNGLYKTLKFLVPIILIVMGMIDFAKAVISQDENKMKEEQRKFVRRIIGAVLILFVLALVQFLIRLVNIEEKDDIGTCIDCFINNSSKCTKYKDTISTTTTTTTSTKDTSKPISGGGSGGGGGTSSGGDKTSGSGNKTSGGGEAW